MRKKPNNQNSSNEVEDLMLKGHLLPQLASDGGALASMCSRIEKLRLNVVAY
jgi:hypothetical protein